MSIADDLKISVVIPCLGGIEFTEKLLDSLLNQTFKKFEIVFVNSNCNESDEIEKKISQYSTLDINIVSTMPLCPGDARNLGVLKANSNLVAFLDVRTIPARDWLEKITDFKLKFNHDIVLGKFVCKTNNIFQELVKSATFGNYASDSLPGSLLSKDLFNDIGGFIQGARSGEDEEWLERVHNSQYSIGRIDYPTLSYYGLPKNAIDLVKKWFFYSIKSAPINVAQSQKGAYFFLMFLFLIYFFLNWNYIFTNDQWDESPYFVPHINKIVWGIFFFIYFLISGFFMPLQRGVTRDFLFPYNWLKLSLVGLMIDLSKLPGRILGYFYFIRMKLSK